MNARAGDSNGVLHVPAPDRVLFLVLTAILCVRPLISESFAQASLSFLPVKLSGGTTPATTAGLDAILLIAAVLVCIRHWRRGPRLPVVAALGLLLAAVVVSVMAAGDKRLAANAGAHLFVMAFAATALVAVLRARWMVHLLIAAVLASGVANAAKCITQRAYEFDDSLEFWLEQKAALIANGIEVDTPSIINYERRLRSSQTFGYLSHPNVAASCLTMCLLVAAGLFMGVLRRPDLDASRRTAGVLVAAVFALTLASGAWLTGSTGAGVSAAVAGAMLLLLGLAQSLAAKHARGVFGLLVSAYLAVIAVGAGYGLLKGTLPQTSLAFRWQYWQAAARACRDAPLTGIGRENFRSAYLLYKPPESTEEVNNPHNLWLTLLVELGPLGLLAGILLISGGLHRALCAVGRAERAPPTRAGWLMPVALAIVLLLVQAILSGEPFGAPGVLLLWSVYVAGIWVLAFFVAYRLIAQVNTHPRAAAWLAAGLFTALCAALIHNLIGLSLFTPAGLAVFISLSAGAIALRAAGSRAQLGSVVKVPSARLPAVVVTGLLLVMAYGWFIARPTFLTRGVRDRIVSQLRSPVSADNAYSDLAQAGRWTSLDRWDADLPLTLARLALEFGRNANVSTQQRVAFLDLATSYIRVARERTAKAFAVDSTDAAIWTARAAASADVDDLRAAARQWQIAVTRYPTDPRARISAGDAAYRVWRITRQDEYARQAVAAYQAAFEIDATRKPDVAAKLRPRELENIRQNLDELHAAGVATNRGSP